MVILYQSQTCPVNPPNTLPLTLAELWEVMLLKCRSPQLFVAPISHCKVLEETPTTLKREVTFKEGLGPPGGVVIEELEIRAPWKVDFYMRQTGAFVNNTISQGKDATDLYLTFYLEWSFPDIREGSEEAEKKTEQLWDQARTTVQHTIDVTREMKRDGKIKGLFEGKF